MNNQNPFKNTRVEFHILQSFPVSCLNRDDVGSPKTAIVGGCTRARVSSQCWKRYVRLSMNELGVPSGTRTKLLSQLVVEACKDEGATDEQAQKCGQSVQNIFIKDEKTKEGKTNTETKEDKKNDTLIFLSPNEIKAIALEFKTCEFAPDEVLTQKDAKKRAKELEKVVLKHTSSAVDALDVALFGRMVAQATNMNVEAAASFAHAISTHKVNNEVEFFSALDDRSNELGAAHLGSLEYNSATYYRYISLDLGQLFNTLIGIELATAMEAFVKALFVAVPNARQTTMSAASHWDFAKIQVRKGQRLQLSFETAIKPKDNGYLQPSIEALTQQLSIKEQRAGSLFGKQVEWTFGEGSLSIDDLIHGLKQYIQSVQS